MGDALRSNGKPPPLARDPSGRPRGRAEIVAAVLRAATNLFAERGPAAVSLRDVAAAADVTLSLINRHIGNKHALLAAVLAADLATQTGQAPDVRHDDLASFLKMLFRADAAP